MSALRRTRLTTIAVVIGGAFLTWLEWQASPNAVPIVLAFDLAVGWSFLGAGLIARGVRIAPNVGSLWIAAGLAWFAGALISAGGTLYLGFVAHVLATFPTGRAARGIQRIVVAAGYVVAIAEPQLGMAGVEAGVMAIVAALAFGRASSPGGFRRGATSSAIAASVIAVTFALAGTGVATGSISVTTARIAMSAALILTAVMLALDLRWGGWSQDALARLVIDLGDRAEPVTLRDRLAEAVDDPSLVIGYRLETGGSYVDDAGRPIELPAPSTGAVVVPLSVSGYEVAVLIRSGAAPSDPILTAGVSSAAEMAIGNARLHAETRRQVSALEGSRIRLIEVAERERGRIQRELEEGALRRIVAVRDRLNSIAGLGAERERLLEHASLVIEQLTELSAGLGPATALRRGLRPALERLVQDSGLAVRLTVDTGDLPSSVEAAAYYVCSEGLANVGKHAKASRASVVAREAGGWLIVDVLDDGVGGADHAAGSGLAGLRERLETLGGRLTIDEPDGGGTRLRAELPIGRPTGFRKATGPPGRRA